MFRNALSAALAALMLACFSLADDWRYDGPLALKSVTLISGDGTAKEGVTILVRDGRIEAIGPRLEIPVGVRTIDGANLFAYPGFVDGFTRAGVSGPRNTPESEARVEGDFLSISADPQATTPEANRHGVFARRGVEDYFDLSTDTFEKQRQAGFCVGLLAPPQGLLGGRARLASLGAGPARASWIDGLTVQTASFNPPERAIAIRSRYPLTALGVAAHLRQFFSDARWYADAMSYAKRRPDAARVTPFDADLEAIQPVVNGEQRLAWEADNAEEIHRALDIAEEFGLKLIIIGGAEAWRVSERLKQSGTPVVLGLNLPGEVKDYKLDTKALAKAPGDTSFFGKNWQKRPFYPEEAVAVAKAQRERRIHNAIELHKAGVPLAFSTFDLKDASEALGAVAELIKAGLPEEAAVTALTGRAVFSPALGMSSQFGEVREGAPANLTLLTRRLGDEHAQTQLTLVAGRVFEFSTSDDSGDKKRGERKGRRGKAASHEEGEEQESDEPAQSQPTESAPASQPESAPESLPAPGPRDDLVFHRPDWSIESDDDRQPAFRTGGSVLLKNALVLTVSGDNLPETDVLIEHGRIKAIGRGLSAATDVRAVDLTGCVVMPGIIDPHSHIALSAVNEFTLSVVPEVRCRDVIDPDDVDIYRALAGGVTAIHTMHGSANTIGGQNVLLKLKYGRPAAEMIIPDTVRTVKFALGENVKRSGMTERRRDDAPRRFPGSRMGVEATARRALAAGRAYKAQLEAFQTDKAAGKDPAPVRRDLRREALADILDGKIWINSHCYRSDEILRLLSVAEDFGVRIAALHHVLDGYRIVPEIARHGCSTATFADWWAYKIEAYEAVPQNAGMLLRGGVNSCIKSDSSDLMRHLNSEAAKCMKYSGLTENETLRLITLNPARMFGLEGRLGSIEVGKDGDIAVFDGHPLDAFAKCILTIVEGEVVFTHPSFKADAAPLHTVPAKDFAALTHPNPAALLAEPVTPSQQTPKGYAILNATLHPVSGPDIENGVVLIEGDKIAAVGAGLKPVDGFEVIDASGLHVYPGLINADTQVGLSEIGAVGVTNDYDETGEFQPDIRAVSALNPQSAMIEVTRAEGVLTALITPSSPTVAGEAGLVNLAGWTMNEMLIEPAVGLVVRLPGRPGKGPITEERRRRRGPRADDPNDGGGSDDAIQQVERFFRDARLYAQAQRADEKFSDARRDPRFDAMAPYVLGERPTMFRAESYKAILEALIFADELKLKPVILGGRDAWKLADVLAARQIPVIYEGVFDIPSGVPGLDNAGDDWDANYRAASVMAEAGVKFCFSHRSADLAKLVPFEAGFAVAHGLDPQTALRAMTLTAAEILGVSDRLGSLEPGKLATLIITTDHPCQTTCVVKRAFITGKPVALESKHSRDAARFQARPAPNLPPPRTDLKGPASRTAPKSG